MFGFVLVALIEKNFRSLVGLDDDDDTFFCSIVG